MLYHEHLRKDLPSADSVQYRHLPLRGITQKEQDGLIAFLQLTTVIVNWVSNLLFGFINTFLFLLQNIIIELWSSHDQKGTQDKLT